MQYFSQSGESEELEIHRYNQIHMGVIFGFLRFRRDASHFDVMPRDIRRSSNVRCQVLLFCSHLDFASHKVRINAVTPGMNNFEHRA